MMQLSKVVVVNSVEVFRALSSGGENFLTLSEVGGAKNIRFENGLVWFEDAKGSHWVPLANVRFVDVAPEPERAVTTKEPKR